MFLVSLYDRGARGRTAFWLAAALALCVLFPKEGHATGRPCCNLETGEFVAIEDVDECNATPGHVHIGKNAENTMQVMACYQKTQQQLMGNQYPGSQYLNDKGMPDMSAISGMMNGGAGSADPDFQCCDTAEKKFIGLMTAAACQENGASYLPDSPENLAATQVCRGTGGGGAWNKEDYEPNITNGGLEEWRDENRPENFTTWGLAPEIARSYPIDIQVAFRSGDAHTGSSSLRLKPADDPKNRVKVEVTLNVVPTRPVNFYFRSFDVDDPTADDDEVDDESEADDNRGDVPRKEGLIISPTGEILEKEFAKIREDFEFEVTKKPGDNLRIAGFGDRDYLLALENDDQKVAKFSGRPATWIFEKNILDKTENPAKARMAEHDKYVSPVLTVWRRLYLEVDDMAPVENTLIESTIENLRRAGTETRTFTNPDGTQGSQTFNIVWIKIRTTLASKLPESSKEKGLAGLENSWAGGRIVVDDSVTLNVMGNTAKSGGFDEIKTGHSSMWLGETAKGLPVKLYDDDAFNDGDSVPKIDLSRMVDVYAPAYVLPMVDALLPNKNSVRPFMPHAISDQREDLKRMMAPYFDHKNLDDDPDFWIAYLQNGYQGALPEDADPEAAALSGQADNDPATGRGGWGAIIYQESARESQRNYGAVPGWRLQDIAPHEIGHLFGGEHSHSGLMSESPTKGPVFDDKTLNAIRSRDNP